MKWGCDLSSTRILVAKCGPAHPGRDQSGPDWPIMKFTDQHRSQDTRKGCPYHGWTGARVGEELGKLGAPHPGHPQGVSLPRLDRRAGGGGAEPVDTVWKTLPLWLG